MKNRAIPTITLLLVVAGLGFAETQIPFDKGAEVRVYTNSRTFEGKLQDSADKNWIRITDSNTKADVWVPLRAVEAVSRVRPSVAAPGGAPGGGGKKKYVVYVHGICKHDPGYSDGWWEAMKPYTPNIPDNARKEVLWSDIIVSGPGGPGGPPAKQRELTTNIQDELRDRAQRQRTDVGGEQAEGPGGIGDSAREVAKCVGDFSWYLVNQDIRNRVIERFNQVVKPLIQDENSEIEVISHSWGTVVAYEALRLMDDDPALRGRVHNLFTVGSALSISEVKRNLLSSAADGKRPRVVQHWVNLNARFDIVGGALKGRPFAVDDEFLGLPPVGCSTLIPNPGCAHSSYFSQDNERVNRDIFGRFISEPQSSRNTNRRKLQATYARSKI